MMQSLLAGKTFGRISVGGERNKSAPLTVGCVAAGAGHSATAASVRRRMFSGTCLRQTIRVSDAIIPPRRRPQSQDLFPTTVSRTDGGIVESAHRRQSDLPPPEGCIPSISDRRATSARSHGCQLSSQFADSSGCFAGEHAEPFSLGAGELKPATGESRVYRQSCWAKVGVGSEHLALA